MLLRKTLNVKIAVCLQEIPQEEDCLVYLFSPPKSKTRKNKTTCCVHPQNQKNESTQLVLFVQQMRNINEEVNLHL